MLYKRIKGISKNNFSLCVEFEISIYVKHIETRQKREKSYKLIDRLHADKIGIKQYKMCAFNFFFFFFFLWAGSDVVFFFGKIPVRMFRPLHSSRNVKFLHRKSVVSNYIDWFDYCVNYSFFFRGIYTR